MFLVRLGASSFLVGLLTAMPALTGMLLAMPVGEFLSRRRNIVPWFARSRFAVLSCYVLTGLVPFLVKTTDPRPSLRSGRWPPCRKRSCQVAFTVVMGGVAGPQGRFMLMSRRWAILGLTNSLTVVVVGQVLSWFDFPLNYQVVFIGFRRGRADQRRLLSAASASASLAVSPARQSLVRDPAPARRHAAPEPALRQLHPQPVRLSLGDRPGDAAVPDLLGAQPAGATDPADQRHQQRADVCDDGGLFPVGAGAAAPGRAVGAAGARLRHQLYPLLTALTQQVRMLVVWAALAGLFSAGVDLVFFDSS